MIYRNQNKKKLSIKQYFKKSGCKLSKKAKKDTCGEGKFCDFVSHQCKKGTESKSKTLMISLKWTILRPSNF